MGKFLKPCVGFSVGKMVWSVSSYSEIVNEFLSPENLFGSQKSGRFGVRLIVARSSFTLAPNGGNLPQAGNTKIRMSPKLQNTTNFPPKHVQPGLRQIAVMAGSPSKSHSGHLLPRTFCLSLAVWRCKIFLTCILKAFPEY